MAQRPWRNWGGATFSLAYLFAFSATRHLIRFAVKGWPNQGPKERPWTNIARRGVKKAAVAVGHSLLVVAYHILRDGVQYQEMGADHFDRINRHRITLYHMQRLQELGYEVALQPQAAAA